VLQQLFAIFKKLTHTGLIRAANSQMLA